MSYFSTVNLVEEHYPTIYIVNILVYNIAVFYTPITFVQHLDNKEQGAPPPPRHDITGGARHLSPVVCSQILVKNVNSVENPYNIISCTYL